MLIDIESLQDKLMILLGELTANKPHHNAALTVCSLFEQAEIMRWRILELEADLLPRGKPKILRNEAEIDSYFSSLC